jgi:hypothetical protein
MAMSDCVKCWDTPCSCGWDYRNYTKEARLKLAANVLGIPAARLAELLGENTPEQHPMKETPNAAVKPPRSGRS